MKRIAALSLILGAWLGSIPGRGRAAAPIQFPEPPLIASLLKPPVLKRVLEDRDAMVNANLDGDAPAQTYSFYAAMQVRAAMSLTRRILTNYQLYAKMIPYVEKAEYSESSRILKIEGGIWKFKLISSIQFEEVGERWIRYRIVGGHFRGLTGDIFFESMGEKGSLVYMKGGLSGSSWPPKFVIERGAEIVFGFTARRMRSYIESQKLIPEGKTNEKEIPQPRGRLAPESFSGRSHR